MDARRLQMLRGLGVLCIVSSTVVCSFAHATLTDSEKAQVTGFVTAGVAASAARARSLVARPDLTASEVAEPLVRGYEVSPFDERRLRFTEALLFGPGSAPARNTLAPAVVAGLLARASRRMADVPEGDEKRWTRRAEAATAEIASIYRFIDERIANAGRPPEDGHDAAAGIRDDALRSCAERVHEHLSQHSRWWHENPDPPAGVQRLYLQGALTLVDLSRGLIERYVVAEWLGLADAGRAAFERHGVLFHAQGASPDRRTAALAIAERTPSALSSVSLFLVDKLPTSGLVARGELVSAGTPLDGPPLRLAAEELWPEEVVGSEPDAQLARLALVLAQLSAKRALDLQPSLREAAATAVRHAEAGGGEAYLARDLVETALAPRPTATSGLRGLSPEVLLTHTMRLLSVDAPRALDLALIRAAAGRPEPLEQFVLAVSAFGAPARPSVALARVGEGGALEEIKLEKVTYSGALVSGFTLGDKRIQIGRDGSGQVAATIDGKVPGVHTLASFQVNPRRAQSWTAPGGREVTRLFGEPKAASVGDGRFVLLGSAGGFDAVALGPESRDQVVSGRIVVTGSGGGPIVGATAGDTSYAGVALILSERPRQARLVAVDGKGKAWQLAEPVALAPPGEGGHAVRLTLKDGGLEAVVDGRSFAATAPKSVAAGRAGFAVNAGGRLEVRDIDLGGGRKK